MFRRRAHSRQDVAKGIRSVGMKSGDLKYPTGEKVAGAEAAEEGHEGVPLARAKLYLGHPLKMLPKGCGPLE
jgi:hypothetical protein